MICSVVVDIEAKQVNRSFDYLVPTYLEHVIKVGYRVKVPFGRRLVVGFVVEIKNKTTYKKTLKPICDILDVYRPLNEEFIELAKHIAEQNFSFYASALQTMIPTALKISYQKVVTIAKEAQLEDSLRSLFGNKKELSLEGRTPQELEMIYAAVEEKRLILDTKFKKRRNESLKEYVYVLDETMTPSSIQGQRLLSYMLELNEPIEMSVLVEDSGFSKNVVKTLLSRGVLGSYKKEFFYEEAKITTEEVQISFTEEQQKCYESVVLGKGQTYLLHGVTGSGKTEVYMKWIEDVLEVEKTALLLVPEISLTPQITALFKKRFGEQVAIMHSRLSLFERYSAWKRILNKEVQIVIGARSAIFAPLENLGIIIIDEAHEQSYQQDNNPRYNAKDIALIRSETHQCPLILGSATPDVVDYYKALNDDYRLLQMPHRVQYRRMPTCEVVDMANELKSGNKSVFSKSLQLHLKECFERKEQAILFLNRRGHSSFVMCRSCGEVIKCPHCDVSLTYHAYQNVLKCHHCGYHQANVSVCPACGSDKIRYVGSGTQKVMDEIQNLIPEARILRVDLDTTKQKNDYEEAFNRFKNHEADILVGTQMIAKGLDFSDVTLVGVVNADLALNIPTYDASMIAFNLIEQVSGRAGRGAKEGKVIIQTYKPTHYVIESVKNHDYDTFFNKEIELRKWTAMPPFSQAYEIMVCSKDASKAFEEAQNIMNALQKAAKDSLILGPAEALPFKLSEVFRFTIQLKVLEEAVLDKLKMIYPLYQSNKDVDIKIKRM